MKKIFNFSTPEGRFRLAGTAILLFFAVCSGLAPLVATHDPYEQTGLPFETPSWEHLLGCNDVGHDLFSELVYGGRMSLSIGLFAALYATIVATIIALLAGYLRGGTDRVLMRIVDIVMALPFLPLVIVLGVFLGPGMGTQILVISLVMWGHPARELRSQVLKIRESGYIEAARAMGETSPIIILRHVLPELLPLIVPQFVRIAQNAILIESSLSFLGLGDPVRKSWGSMLFFANTRTAFLTGAWSYWVLPPGICIALAVVGFTFIGFSLSGRTGLNYRPFGSFSLTRTTGRNTPPAASAALSVENLTVLYDPGERSIKAADAVSVEVNDNEFVGIVGESGCGKTTVAMSILGLLRSPAQIAEGRIFLGNSELLGAGKDELFRIRGKRLAYIPQNAMNALNPVISIRKQLIETIQIHRPLTRKQALKEVYRLLKLVEIPEERANSFSHELSGGMKQRVVIAMALANNPEVLIADEPTTGLDVLVQKRIITLLMRLKNELNLSVFFITHDLPLVMNVADRIAVMYRGRIVDDGDAATLSAAPAHPHTAELFRNFPRLNDAKKWSRTAPAGNAKPYLSLRNVSKTFRASKTLWGTKSAPVHAVRNVSFDVMPGEVVGIIGGSGSGKTTLARLIMGLEHPDGGDIFLQGVRLDDLGHRQRREMLKAIHLVFQDPYQSMRNGMRILDIVAEPLRIHGMRNRDVIEDSVLKALSEVNLPATLEFAKRFPHELSGGQRQRLAFARAIVTEPTCIIADEPTSMLDVSLRTGLLELMETFRVRHGVGYIFITHDLALARHFCDRLLVMQEGRLLEEGTSDQIVIAPEHAYTKALIDAAGEPEGFAAPELCYA